MAWEFLCVRILPKRISPEIEMKLFPLLFNFCVLCSLYARSEAQFGLPPGGVPQNFGFGMPPWIAGVGGLNAVGGYPYMYSPKAVTGAFLVPISGAPPPAGASLSSAPYAPSLMQPQSTASQMLPVGAPSLLPSTQPLGTRTVIPGFRNATGLFFNGRLWTNGTYLGK